MSHPRVRGRADIDAHADQEVQLEGRYRTLSLGPHALKVEQPDGSYKKVKQVAVIELSDGTRVDLNDRPESEHAALDGRRVTAVGRLVLPAEPAASPPIARPTPAPTLVDIQRVEKRSGWWPF